MLLQSISCFLLACIGYFSEASSAFFSEKLSSFFSLLWNMFLPPPCLPLRRSRFSHPTLSYLHVILFSSLFFPNSSFFYSSLFVFLFPPHLPLYRAAHSPPLSMKWLAEIISCRQNKLPRITREWLKFMTIAIRKLNLDVDASLFSALMDRNWCFILRTANYSSLRCARQSGLLQKRKAHYVFETDVPCANICSLFLLF